MTNIENNDNSNESVHKKWISPDHFGLPDIGSHFLFWPIVIFGIMADLWSKHAVFVFLDTRVSEGYEYSVIDGFFKLVMRENSGAAFSIASGRTVMLISVSLVAFVIVLGLFLFGKIRGRLMPIGLALFTAGIVGNLYDRIFNDGYVRDFLDVYYKDHHWPAFNVADSMLCIAVGLLIITNLMSSFSEKPDLPQTEEL